MCWKELEQDYKDHFKRNVVSGSRHEKQFLAEDLKKHLPQLSDDEVMTAIETSFAVIPGFNDISILIFYMKRMVQIINEKQ